MRILVVEDDEKITALIRRELLEQRYVVDVAVDGPSGEFLALTNDYDLLLLDLLLPGKDGREVCRTLRTNGFTTPILMMTALGEDDDVITGFDVGADDYIVKPFSLGVLLAHIRALVRRQADQKVTLLRIADLELDTVHRTATRAGKPLMLSAKEFVLLEYLMMNRDRLLTRSMISEHVWDMNFDPRSNVIDSLIRFLRQRIDHGFSPQLIHTIRGMGYRFSDQEKRR